MLQNKFYSFLLNFISKYIKKNNLKYIEFLFNIAVCPVNYRSNYSRVLSKNLDLTASMEVPCRLLQAEIHLQDRWQQFTYEHKLQFSPPIAKTQRSL